MSEKIVPQTIYIFSGSFDSWEAAYSYSEQEYPSPENTYSQEYYQAWKKRNPKLTFLEDLSISYIDLNYTETIFGAKEIFSYLDLQLINKKDKEFIRTCISEKINTLVIISISTSARKKINLISTPKLEYHGEFESYDDSIANNLLREQKKAKFNREINKKRQEFKTKKTAIKEKFFTKCKHVYGDTGSKKWNEYNLADFFLSFRTNSDALRELFWSLPKGGFVLNRLQDCFDASKSKTDRRYLLGGDGREMSDRELIQTSIQLLNSFKKMGQCINDKEFVAALTPIPKIQFIEETEPKCNAEYNYLEALDLYIYDVQHQWFATLDPLIPEALWMKEGFYYLNCDYYLARYISWHWYQHSSTIKDPYRDYYQLWRHGVELRCIAPENIKLYRHEPVETVALETTNYDDLKKDVLNKLDRLLQENCDRNIEKTLELWLDFSKHPFFKYTHRANKNLLFPRLTDREESYLNLCKVHLYDADYILKAWNEKDVEHLGTDNFFIVAGIDDGDDMGFVSKDLSRGIAILFHDDVFTRSTIEQELESVQKSLSLVKFFQILDLW